MKLTDTQIKLGVAAIIVFIGVGWYLFSSSQKPEPTISETEPAKPAEALFLELRNNLRITYDTTVFSNARFLALKNFTVPVVPDALGHTDPFKPGAGQ